LRKIQPFGGLSDVLLSQQRDKDAKQIEIKPLHCVFSILRSEQHGQKYSAASDGWNLFLRVLCCYSLLATAGVKSMCSAFILPRSKKFGRLAHISVDRMREEPKCRGWRRSSEGHADHPDKAGRDRDFG
jgi:hypothetical protein